MLRIFNVLMIMMNLKMNMKMKMMLVVGEYHPCTRLKHVETGFQSSQIWFAVVVNCAEGATFQSVCCE